MKKNYFYAVVLALWCGTAMGQLNNFQGVNFGDNRNPVPSLSSLASFTDNPPSIAVGIPEISVPLLSLPGYGGSGISLQLSYDATGGPQDDPIGEVGAGWFLSKGGVISRQINGIMVDELFQSQNNPNYEKNVFDDEYYYNVPGLSGKFKIERDIQQNTFKIIDLSPLNHVKIAYTKQNNTATLIVDSFTITDDQGNIYSFNDYSTAVVYDSYYNEKGLWGTEYKSAFYLTRITDANGVELSGFSYKKETKTDKNGALLYKTCQLEKINTAFGNIEMVYDYDETLQKTLNDPFSIKKIVLNNKYSKNSEYVFEYSYPLPLGTIDSKKKRRQLERVKKMDGQTLVEETSFQYNPLDYTYFQGSSCGGGDLVHPAGILNKITHPAKGVTEYVYETGEVYRDRNSTAYLASLDGDFNGILDPCAQYIKEYPYLDMDTNQSLTYNFTISGDAAKKKAFWLTGGIDYYIDNPEIIDPRTGLPIPPKPLPKDQWITYTLKRGTEIIATNQDFIKTKFYNYPGQYTLILNVPSVGGKGGVFVSELVTVPGPYKSRTSAGSHRLRSMKRYAGVGNTVPVQSVSYNYDHFSIPNASSGEFQINNVMYRNVKVTEDSGKGYTKYYFKLQKDYPSYSYTKDGKTLYFWPYNNIVNSGLVEKKEIYSDSNQLLTKDEYNYTFTDIDDNVYVIGNDKGFSKPAFTSQTKTSSVAYPSGTASSFLQSSGENNVRADNFKPSSSKSTAPDGTVTETFYKYAQDKNQTRLLEANMTGVLLESEVKENGKTIGKSETQFDNGSHLYPSAVIGYNRQTQAPVTTSTLDVYDSKGNLVQATGKNGIPSTTIWGYNQTVPIVVIAGASYAQIASLSSVTAAITASDADNNNPANESALLQALETLRQDPALKDYSITTSTYDPLIGVTNTISANGIRTTNVYDTAGRLVKVKDSEGKILQENQYNYKH
ncbi:YD repeat-containing protein [Chryseobacterium indologenes]|uniref:hypothetical protein n=1 Tax=Chryseobacterium indologenes TaxID=253 RepID=UPI0003E07175|nr:hypothetical protein [Chryseobacterium indologenes]GAE66956.1 hypothetical protein CIN01S_23_00020 [Chryseobacterium indologenes NBRC 14944]SFK31319.1 YD repeat-containing protein [Chryseobacterium indologenes]SUX52911.1 Uncharacterised protein [Chryseobacterium indologenes]